MHSLNPNFIQIPDQAFKKIASGLSCPADFLHVYQHRRYSNLYHLVKLLAQEWQSGVPWFDPSCEHQFLSEHFLGRCHQIQFLSRFLRWHFANKSTKFIQTCHRCHQGSLCTFRVLLRAFYDVLSHYSEAWLQVSLTVGKFFCLTRGPIFGSATLP